MNESPLGVQSSIVSAPVHTAIQNDSTVQVAFGEVLHIYEEVGMEELLVRSNLAANLGIDRC